MLQRTYSMNITLHFVIMATLKQTCTYIFIGCSLLCSANTYIYAKTTVTAQQKKLAQQAASKGISVKYIKKNAPSSYTVKDGDTLWQISAKFLTQPMLWPKLWGVNKTKIINPHLIYPGQTLYLIRKNGYAYLSTSPTGHKESSIKLSPKIRMSGIDTKALPVVPAHILKAFGAQPKVIDAEIVNNAGRIIAGAQAGKNIFALNDIIYTRYSDADTQGVHIFRKAQPIYDPVAVIEHKYQKDQPVILAYEAEYLGYAQKMPEIKNDVSTFKIKEARQEIETGDMLLPVQSTPNYNLQPNYAPNNTQTRIAKVYGGSDFGGQGFVVVLNKGSNAGIKAGHVLKILKYGKTVADKTIPSTSIITSKQNLVTLPNRSVGYALVFNVYNNISYAFISDSSEDVESGDGLVSEDIQ
jgi:LysM repeat protein